MRRPGFLLLSAAVGLAAAGCGGTKTVTVTQTVTRTTTHTVTTTPAQPTAAPCSASELTGTFAEIPGSPGAGQISYSLRLTNESSSQCFVSGLPAGQLLDRSGAVLPTNISPARPGIGSAARIVVEPGRAATAEARFSPDVPGSTEGEGQCEPKSYTLRVSIGGGTVDAPVEPPTPVCERGSLNFSNYSRQ